MPELRNKIILLISPQAWGKMLVSKHHYAVELAKQGNTIYFLNPPEPSSRKENISIETSGIHPGLFLIYHRLSFPYSLKFHLITVFHLFMKQHIKNILKKIDKPVDIIWSFDLGNLYPFRFFPATSYKIFHPVDEPLNEEAIRSADGSQIIFSVTREILEKYKDFKVPKYFINHAVNDSFLRTSLDISNGNEVLHIGLSGNLLRNDIDRPIFLNIINENPNIIFECWGSYQLKDTNIGGGFDEDTKQFIEKLQATPNVVLHGAVDSSRLAGEFRRVDAFLICYDVEKDQSKGTNYHKIMEYLATGKVIISSNVTTYQDFPAMITMTLERDGNRLLPSIFDHVITNLAIFNAPTAQASRKAFAQQNSYAQQLTRIDNILIQHLNTVRDINKD